MKREEQIFEQAIAFPTAEERQAYVRGVCADDPQLRRRVEELLTAFSDAGQMDFLQTTERAEAKTDLQDSPLAEDAGTRIGRYKLLQHIGEGGFGSVFMAEQEEPVRRKVALKIIKLGMDTKQVIARFEAERQALAMMDHPNIAKVLDAGATETGRPYFVMELVKGVPITEFCDKNKLSTEDRLRLFIPVCQAIQSAHQKGIIHRDIKPSNVLVTLEHGEPLPKVIDFGVAKATNQRLTEKTLFTNYATLIGTPAYMSPEQAEMSSLDIDTRADIYSLGVLLYELVTGTTPFSEERLRSVGYGEMQRIIAQEEPERPSTRLSTMTQAQRATVAMNRGANPSALEKAFGSDLDWIVMKCLEKNRSRRYETANGLALDITRHLHNEPIVARPPSTFYKIHKFARRNKVAFTAGVAVLTALLVGLGLANYGLVQARKERDQAEREKTAADKARAAALASERRAQKEELTARHRAYTSDMNVAHQAWEEGNLRRAQSILRRYIPKPGMPDFRGTEWRYLWNLCQEESLRTIPWDPNDRVWQLAGTSAHHFIAALCQNSIRLLHPTSLQELKRLSLPSLRSPATWHIVALTAGTTNLIAAHRSGGEVFLWDLNRKDPPTLVQTYTNGVSSISLSADGRRMAVAQQGAFEGNFSVWDISSGSEPRLLWSPPNPQGTVSALTFTPDSKILLAARSHQVAGITAWDAESGTELAPFSAVSAGNIAALAISPDAQLLAFSGVEGRVHVADIGSRTLRYKFDGHRGRVGSLSFSPDGKRLISAGLDYTIRIWDLMSGQAIGALRNPTSSSLYAIFSPDGQSIISIAAEGLKVWNLEPRAPASTFQTTTGWGFLSTSPNGHWLVATQPFDFRAASALLVNLHNAHEHKSLISRLNHPVAVGFSPDSRFCAVANISKDGIVAIWETAPWSSGTGPFEPGVYLTNHFETGSISFSPDGKIMATAGLFFMIDDPSGATNRLSFWEVGSWKRLDLLAGAGAGPVDTAAAATVAFSHNGRLLAIGYRDGSARLYDFKEQRLIRQLKRHEEYWVGAAVCFSPDDRWLASLAKASGAVHLYDLANPNDPHDAGSLYPSPGGTWDFAFAPDGKSLVTHSSDGFIRFWSLQNFESALTLRHGHGPGGFLAFNPDGTRLATLDAHGVLKLWPMPSFQQIATNEVLK